MKSLSVLKIILATCVVGFTLSESVLSQDQTGMSLGPIQPPAEIGQETICVVFIGQVDCGAGEELSCGSDFPEPETTDEPVYPIDDGPVPDPNPFSECAMEDVGFACLNTPMWRINGEDSGAYANYSELGTPHENQGVTALANPLELQCSIEGDCICEVNQYGVQTYDHDLGIWKAIETTRCITKHTFEVTGHYYVPNTDDVCDLSYIVDPFEPVDPNDPVFPEDPFGPSDDGPSDDGTGDPTDGSGDPSGGGGSSYGYGPSESDMAAEQAAYEAQMAAEQAAYEASQQAAYEAQMAAEQAAYEAAMAAQQQYGP